MRKVAALGIVIAVLLGPAAGLAAAQTEPPSPTDAFCTEDPLAALPPELAPLTSVLGPLITTFCDAIPEDGGGLPSFPGLPGGGEDTGGGIPVLSDILAPLCSAGADGLGALPPEAAPLVDLLGTLLEAGCGDTTGGAPSENPLAAFCAPGSDPFAAVPEQLAPLTDLFGTLIGTLCGFLPSDDGAPGEGGGGGEGGTPVAAPTPGPGPGSSAGAVGGASLPRTGTDSGPLVAGSLALVGLAIGLRALRSRAS